MRKPAPQASRSLYAPIPLPREPSSSSQLYLKSARLCTTMGSSFLPRVSSSSIITTAVAHTHTHTHAHGRNPGTQVNCATQVAIGTGTARNTATTRALTSTVFSNKPHPRNRQWLQQHTQVSCASLTCSWVCATRRRAVGRCKTNVPARLWVQSQVTQECKQVYPPGVLRKHHRRSSNCEAASLCAIEPLHTEPRTTTRGVRLDGCAADRTLGKRRGRENKTPHLLDLDDECRSGSSGIITFFLVEIVSSVENNSGESIRSNTGNQSLANGTHARPTAASATKSGLRECSFTLPVIYDTRLQWTAVRNPGGGPRWR